VQLEEILITLKRVFALFEIRNLYLVGIGEGKRSLFRFKYFPGAGGGKRRSGYLIGGKTLRILDFKDLY